MRLGAGSVARRRPQIRRRAVRPPSGAAARAGARPGPRPPPSASLFGEKEIAAPLGARPPGIAQLKIGSEPTPQTGSCGRESRVAAGDAPYLERGAGRRQEAAARSRAREWVTTVVNGGRNPVLSSAVGRRLGGEAQTPDPAPSGAAAERCGGSSGSSAGAEATAVGQPIWRKRNRRAARRPPTRNRATENRERAHTADRFVRSREPGGCWRCPLPRARRRPPPRAAARSRAREWVTTVVNGGRNPVLSSAVGRRLGGEAQTPIRRRAVRPPSGAAARAGARPGPRPPPSASLFGEKEIAAPLGARPPGIAQLKIGSEPTPQTGSCGRESRVAAGDAPYLERGAGRRQEAAARSRAREWVTTVVNGGRNPVLSSAVGRRLGGEAQTPDPAPSGAAAERCGGSSGSSAGAEATAVGQPIWRKRNRRAARRPPTRNRATENRERAHTADRFVRSREPGGCWRCPLPRARRRPPPRESGRPLARARMGDDSG